MSSMQLFELASLKIFISYEILSSSKGVGEAFTCYNFNGFSKGEPKMFIGERLRISMGVLEKIAVAVCLQVWES
jgi:hypothetical protein